MTTKEYCKHNYEFTWMKFIFQFNPNDIHILMAEMSLWNDNTMLIYQGKHHCIADLQVLFTFDGQYCF